MSAPRVLVSGVVFNQPMGGVRRHNAELLPRAARLLDEGGGGLAVMEGSAPCAFELPEPIVRLSSKVPAHPVIARGAAEGLALRKVLAVAEREGRAFDVVHTAHMPAPGHLSVPFTLTLHDLRAIDLKHNSISRRTFGRWVVGQALERAARVVTVSEALREALVERFGVDAGKVRVVPNAADHLRVLPRAVKAGAWMLHVGHLERRKNVEVVLRALALDEELPGVTLAGAAKGDEGERLKAVCRELGVEQRVRFAGSFEERELPRMYAEAACVVVPSLVEGFGMAALEARRAGVPLAVSRIPALMEVAGAGTPSFGVEEPGECAAALREALGMGAEVLEEERVRAGRFGWESSARALVGVWGEVRQ